MCAEIVEWPLLFCKSVNPSNVGSGVAGIRALIGQLGPVGITVPDAFRPPILLHYIYSKSLNSGSHIRT